MNPVRFAGLECGVECRQYPNGRVALQLVTYENGYPEPVARATINLPECDLAENEVIIKDYSENHGMLDALVDAGIVYPPERHALLDYNPAPICRLVNPAP